MHFTDDENLIIKDEMNARAFDFWRAWKSGAWPHSSKEYCFLGDAIHRSGQAIFGEEWTDDTPLLAFLPFLDGRRPYVQHGFDGTFALALVLGEATGEQVTLSEPLTQFRFHRQKWRNPMADEAWHKAIKIFNARHAARQYRAGWMFRAVAREMVEAAAKGKLVLGALSYEADFTPSNANDWAGQLSFSRFCECQMNFENPKQQFVPYFEDLMAGATYPPLLAGHNWLYATTDSLEAFLRTRKKAKAPPAESDGTKAINPKKLEDAFRLIVSAVTDNEWFTPRPTLVSDLLFETIPGLGRDQARDFIRDTAEWPSEWEKKRGNYVAAEKSARDQQTKQLREKLREEFGGNTRH